MRQESEFILRLALGAILLAAFQILTPGCSTLPKMSEMLKDSPQDYPQPLVVSGHTTLSPDESKALLERITRSTDATNIVERYLVVMQHVSGLPLIKGNEVILLTNVQKVCRIMLETMRNAKDSINLEAYMIKNDAIGIQFHDLIVKKCKEGVRVNLIYDSVGCYDAPAHFFRSLRAAGAEVVEFNPVNPSKARIAWRIACRDHSKLLIVDGRVVITGGINIRVPFSRRPFEEKDGPSERIPWRDTDVQIEGPAVSEFQRMFLDTWKRQTGVELPGTNYFPLLKDEGDNLVTAVGSRSDGSHRDTFIMYNAAISFAARSVHLTCPYFAPDAQTRKTLMDAARRGVDVTIVVPGVSDHRSSLYAGQYYFSELIESGVKLYRRRDALLHAKTAVIDGVWSTVGSSNMDYWSLLRNEEVNTIILGGGFADQMERVFEDDVMYSEPIQLKEWRKRSLLPQVREWLAHLFVYWL